MRCAGREDSVDSVAEMDGMVLSEFDIGPAGILQEVTINMIIQYEINRIGEVFIGTGITPFNIRQ